MTQIEWRHEHEWPLKRTQWTKFYFDLSQRRAPGKPQTGILAPGKSDDGEFVHLSGVQPRHHGLDLGGIVAGDGRRHQARHGHRAADAASAARHRGHRAARRRAFWVSSESEDMDLFLTLRNFDADGNEILETGQQGTPVPVAKGWLRVSHRELDPELTLPYRPYHKHHAAALSEAGRDREGAGRNLADLDGVQEGPSHPARRAAARRRRQRSRYLHYHADYNTGSNTIYAGGEREFVSAAADYSAAVTPDRARPAIP